MKIAWFTPYHPQSSIGNYSQEAVAGLREEDEVFLFAPAAGVTPPPRADGGPVETVGDGPYDDLAQRLQSCDVVVYNLGNHHYNHRMVYEVAIRHPGIVVLHDLVMRDFFRHYHHSQQNDADWLARHILYSNGLTAGPLTPATAQRCRRKSDDEDFALEYPMFESAIHRCLGVIVHSEYSRERVANACSSPVVMLDFPPHGPCIRYAPAAGPKPSQQSGKTQILTFGVLNPNKLIHKVIEQIGQSRYLRDNVTYAIIGEGDKKYMRRLRELIIARGLSQIVTLTGWLSDADLWRQLTRADLVVNLRNPHMGESSGSLLNALFAGSAILVWNHGCYAEFPDDVVHKISSEDALAPTLERLCRDRFLRERMGSNARRHALARFNTSSFCRRFREFAGKVQAVRPVLGLTDLISDCLLEFGAPCPPTLIERMAGEVAALTETTLRKDAALAA